ncbi:hypothetical protein BV25DRAFT_1781055, partial [Artomyces pyxidatus]
YLNSDHPSFETHVSRLRRVDFVPVLLGPTLPRADRTLEERNAFCRAMLILFKPWRNLRDLKAEEESWSQAYDRVTFGDYVQNIIRNINVEHECRDARERIDTERR